MKMPNTTPILETKRLYLRPLELADAAAIQRVFPQWEIVKYLTSKIPWPYPDGEAKRFLSEIALPAIERGEEWQWSIRPKTNPAQLIGVMHLMNNPDENRGFWLAPDWQGQGLMTEACEAATDYWFDVLQMPVLRAPKAVVNTPSRRISERSGMRLLRSEDREYLAGRLKAEVWEITADEWRARPRIVPAP
jgi:RimJ/RimL family protein N-acetyltransferase